MPQRPCIPTNPNTIVTASLDVAEGWIEYPLGDDVIDGDPRCRVKILRTVGAVTARKSVSFFTANPARFHWRFDDDEAFVLLEGHIRMRFDNDEQMELKAGDALSIPAGHSCVCEVLVPSRKFTVVTRGLPE